MLTESDNLHTKPRGGEKQVDMKQAGEKLKELRGCRTQTGVARAVGITPSALSMYESGERVPRDEVKERLCAYYGVPVPEVFYPGTVGQG